VLEDLKRFKTKWVVGKRKSQQPVFVGFAGLWTGSAVLDENGHNRHPK
jgi:hypothetical protein